MSLLLRASLQRPLCNAAIAAFKRPFLQSGLCVLPCLPGRQCRPFLEQGSSGASDLLSFDYVRLTRNKHCPCFATSDLFKSPHHRLQLGARQKHLLPNVSQ